MSNMFPNDRFLTVSGNDFRLIRARARLPPRHPELYMSIYILFFRRFRVREEKKNPVCPSKTACCASLHRCVSAVNGLRAYTYHGEYWGENTSFIGKPEGRDIKRAYKREKNIITTYKRRSESPIFYQSIFLFRVLRHTRRAHCARRAQNDRDHIISTRVLQYETRCDEGCVTRRTCLVRLDIVHRSIWP